MCRVKTVEYEPELEAVPQARRWLMSRLSDWDLDDLAADAALIITEVVTNGVVHAQTRLHVSAAVAEGVLEVGVTDDAAALPRPGSHAATLPGGGLQGDDGFAEGGRGMLLIDALADEWGVAQLSKGKQVWFRLTVHEAWPHRTSCPCHGSDLKHVRLASGGFAVDAAGDWDTERAV
jgi:anti-sigma regulatory factor (Ser/Thr protein kinase)